MTPDLPPLERRERRPQPLGGVVRISCLQSLDGRILRSVNAESPLGLAGGPDSCGPHSRCPALAPLWDAGHRAGAQHSPRSGMRATEPAPSTRSAVGWAIGSSNTGTDQRCAAPAQPSLPTPVTCRGCGYRDEPSASARCALEEGVARTSLAAWLAAERAAGATGRRAFGETGPHPGTCVAAAADAREQARCSAGGGSPRMSGGSSKRRTQRSIVLGLAIRRIDEDFTKLSKAHGEGSGRARLLGHLRGPTGLRRAYPVGRAAKLSRSVLPAA